MNQPFYASSQINRHGDFRSNKKLIEKIISDKKTKFVPVLKGKNLFKQSNEYIEACFFNRNCKKIESHVKIWRLNRC